jgi:hypothetical protein
VSTRTCTAPRYSIVVSIPLSTTVARHVENKSTLYQTVQRTIV